MLAFGRSARKPKGIEGRKRGPQFRLLACAAARGHEPMALEQTTKVIKRAMMDDGFVRMAVARRDGSPGWKSMMSRAPRESSPLPDVAI